MTYRKTTPEEWARWRENHERLLRIIERRKAEDEAARARREQAAAETRRD